MFPYSRGMSTYPRLLHTVLDAVDVRREAEFWRQLLGLVYRPGDEEAVGEDEHDWLVLTDPGGRRVLAFQQVDQQARTTWPSQEVPMQLHLDTTVASVAELEIQRQRAVRLGASELLDRTDDPDEPLYVLADPEGHPFCIFVAPADAPTTAYDLPVGDWYGSCAFRMMPTDDFADAPSTLSIGAAASGRAVTLSYTWQHPDDGEQSGTLLLGTPGEDGAVSAAWVDSWHQPAVGLLTGTTSRDGAEVAYEYAPGWTWEVGVRRGDDDVSMVMRNVVPEGQGGPAGAYVVMQARWS